MPYDYSPYSGALAMTCHMTNYGAKNKKHDKQRAFILPKQSAEEASLVKDAVIYPANPLLEVYAHLSGAYSLAKYEAEAAHKGMKECLVVLFNIDKYY